ncbi:hypothetical protein A6A19_05165 [Actinobacillus delphinicola]|uniref:Abi family protein n=1 Tax=Actinobacillus delphinicola TaxID=51161 RepID=UPI002441DE4E|nr:Abi family protein [Actinobacillus delphinicola]MDG6897386.1 hypothetical protein [Actinobacillus delphinicola]
MTSNKKEVPPWHSYEQQLTDLRKKGMIINDSDSALTFLRSVGYYRFSGYAHAFRQGDKLSSKFNNKTLFQDVQQLYFFDKKLRSLILEALETIEIALRVDLSYLLGEYDPLSYKKEECFELNGQKMKDNYDKWKKKLDKKIKDALKKGEESIKHYNDNYEDYPIWVVAGVWDFGTIVYLFKYMKFNDRKKIAGFYGLSKEFGSCLQAMNVLRNICAHHGRLWNKHIAIGINTSNLGDEWEQLKRVKNKPFFYFCIIKYLLNNMKNNAIDVQDWTSRFIALLEHFPEPDNQAVTLKDMGVIEGYKDWGLWQL